MKIFASTSLFVLLLLDITSTLAIKGASSDVGNSRSLQATFKVTKVGPKESKDSDPKGTTTKDDGNNNVDDPQDEEVIPEDSNEEDNVQVDGKGVKGPKDSKKDKSKKKCKKPKKAKKERRSNRSIRMLKEPKGGPKEAKAPKEPKAPKGVSTSEVGPAEEKYCLHADFTAEQCADLQDGSLKLKDGSISGDLNIQVLHDDTSPSETLESMEDILMYETKAKYIGCGYSDINEIRHRYLLFGNDNEEDDTSTENDEGEEDKYPKVTAIDFSDMKVDEEGCGDEVDTTDGNSCSLIKTSFEIQYMTEDDVTPEQEDEMYDLLTEIMQKQVDGGEFSGVGDVQSITLGSLSSGTSNEDNGDGSRGGVGIPVGVAVGAFAILVAIIAYYCYRRRRLTTAHRKANDSVTTGSDNDHKNVPQATVVQVEDDNDGWFWNKKKKDDN